MDWSVDYCGLLWCFYQLFGLSFRRHPFTADDSLVSKLCNATFLQICSDAETNSSTFWMAWVWVNVQQTFIFVLIIPSDSLYYHQVHFMKNIILRYEVHYKCTFITIKYTTSFFSRLMRVDIYFCTTEGRCLNHVMFFGIVWAAFMTGFQIRVGHTVPEFSHELNISILLQWNLLTERGWDVRTVSGLRVKSSSWKTFELKLDDELWWEKSQV